MRNWTLLFLGEKGCASDKCVCVCCRVRLHARVDSCRSACQSVNLFEMREAIESKATSLGHLVHKFDRLILVGREGEDKTCRKRDLTRYTIAIC